MGIDLATTEASAARRDGASRRGWTVAIAVLLGGVARWPDANWDPLYWAAVAAAGYLAYRVATAARPRSSLVRGALLTIVLFAGAEMALRAGGYHRTLYYDRAGDLLFAPRPDQQYLEKVSMTPSRANELGLRGGPVEREKRLILCLGDSIVYGYGVSDDETLPARLDAEIGRLRPNEFDVLNGGVNAYPVSFMRLRFLRLWEQGLRPEAVIVGYSFNEGWLGALTDADEETKRSFERRVILKNALRSVALYNVVMENWARSYYDAIKARLVPGTHAAEVDPAVEDDGYERELDRFLTDLRSRGVKAYFVVFAAFNGRHGRFDSDGPLHNRFAAFFEERGETVIRTDQVFRAERGPDADLWPLFLDYAHMSPAGTAALAEALAPRLAAELDRGSRP